MTLAIAKAIMEAESSWKSSVGNVQVESDYYSTVSRIAGRVYAGNWPSLSKLRL